jgi:hypothetical protein
MAAHRSWCRTRESVGSFIWHEVSFHGPADARACELPENQQGHVAHTFENLSIYPVKFTTTASTSPDALKVVGSASPPGVTVPAPKKGAFRRRPEKRGASQRLEHQAGTGVGLPHTAAVDFATTVTSTEVELPPAPNAPAISVMLIEP